MAYHEQSEDYRPLFWMQGHPVYAHTLLIVAHIIAMVAATCCAFAFSTYAVVAGLVLDTNDVFHGEVWRLASYIIFMPSLWFVFAMGFLYFTGREVEQFVGRRQFLVLYAALIFIPALLLCLAGLFYPMEQMGGTESIYGLFVALATIYPGLVLNIWFVNLAIKHWALVLGAIYTMIDLANHNPGSLIILWSSAAVGYLGMRFFGAGRGMTWFSDWMETRRTEKLAQQRNFKIVKEKKETQSIDEILEKISKHGVGSLDAQERAALERARTKLLQRDQS